eukprot:gene13018-15909_t
MPLTLPKAQKADILSSLQRYLSTELDHELGDIQASHLLDYILKEIAPFAYNQGIEDAKTFLTSKLEDLTGTCFAECLTYWHTPAPGTRHQHPKPMRLSRPADRRDPVKTLKVWLQELGDDVDGAQTLQFELIDGLLGLRLQANKDGWMNW